MNHISLKKVRRAATKGLSVGLSATTTLWLVGSSLIYAVPVAHASNDAVVSDITASNPRIAPNGESELAVLGVNIQMDVNPNGVDKRLQSVALQLKSDDAAGNGEAALANMETGRLYADSGLSGTGGQFDSNDALVSTTTRTVAGAFTANVGAIDVVAADTGIDTVTPANAPADGTVVHVKIGTGLVAEVREATYETNDTVADGAACESAAGANTCLDLDGATNGPAVTFAHDGTDAGGVGGVAGETIRQVTAQITDAAISNSAGNGFSRWAAAGTGARRTGYELAVIFGDTAADADADVLTFTPPTTDTGNDAGNDLFFSFLTAGGVANQTFIASIWPDEVAAELVRMQLHDILLDNAGGGGNIAVNSNVTNNESKTVTMGSDNVAPTISRVEMFDNDSDGNVDRAEVVFNESMGNTVTATGNFVTVNGTGVVGNANAIASVPASNDDADLNANGTWVSGTGLNTILRIDFQGDTQSANCAAAENDAVATYCNATASTGDTFSVVYDQANATIAADDLVDATGTVLADATVSSTDKARPVIMTAAQAVPGTFQVRDNDGNSAIDELRVTGSEAWGAASTVSGVELRRTDVNPNVIYTLSGVNGFVQSAGTAAVNANLLTSNANDTIRLAVAAGNSNDVAGVFQLNYTAASTLVDAAGNEARSATGLAAVSGIVPVISTAWIVDINNAAAGADIDGAADADGQIDGLVAIFNVAVDVDEDGVGILATTDMALSGGYAFNAQAPLDEDDDRLLVFPITQSGAADTDLTPDWTYTNDGSADGEALCAAPAAVGNACVGAADVLIDSVVSSTVTETNRSGPVILAAPNGVVLYETTPNDIWETSETLVVTFSEAVDAASFRTSYVNDGLFNGPSDFGWAIGGGANAMPNTVTVGVTGRVVTMTASESATAALTAADTIMVGANEIYDLQGNAAPGPVTGGGVIDALMGGGAEQSLTAATALTVTPAAAPAVLRVSTNDENNNGILDSFIVEFGGLIKPASITMANFGAARGANFAANTLGIAPANCGGAAGDNWACSTTAVSSDLTLSSVATVSGGNDSRLIVRYAEAAENAGARPQLKYVQGVLSDLAGNLIATFNANAATNTQFDLNITNGAGDFPARDGVAPKAMLKFVRDRDKDGKADQLLLVFSETMLNGAGTVANGVLASNGWTVVGKAIAANGLTSNNTDFQHITFATISNIWTVDVTEGATADSTIPSVSYTSSGLMRDAGGNVLGNVAAGGETADFTATPTVTVMNGDLVKGSGPAVYIVKLGSTFKRHVLSDQMGAWYAHLSPFWSKVKTITDTELNAMTLSAWVRVAGTASVYEVNDDRTAHHLTCNDDAVAGQDCANEWTAAGGNPAGIYDINAAEWGYYIPSNPVVLPDQPN